MMNGEQIMVLIVGVLVLVFFYAGLTLGFKQGKKKGFVECFNIYNTDEKAKRAVNEIL